MRSAAIVLFYFSTQCCLYSASPALTIYNQDFAVIRDLAPLTLKARLNSIEYTGMTAQAEPESVVLRDPSGRFVWQIVEQNYRKDAASMERLLELYEGKTIQFQMPDGKIVSGRILRAPSRPAVVSPVPYNPPLAEQPQAMLEAEGQVRFGLPGTPLFPARLDQVRSNKHRPIIRMGEDLGDLAVTVVPALGQKLKAQRTVVGKERVFWFDLSDGPRE